MKWHPENELAPVGAGAGGQTAQDIAEIPERIICGRLPSRKNTVLAEVLMRMLRGERMTSLQAVAGASTTRLASVAEQLHRVHGWQVSTEPRAVGCADGRVATVAVYFIAPTVAAAAGAAGRDWCAQVAKARAARRFEVESAKREAARRNRLRDVARSSVGQRDLFDGGAA